ncbi:hypothetical protein [Trujillonella humicola]|uniref:hypothetical protein n=1 Tax=Trujillonella humicola TaxID=3383699 RepID=UPI0039069523
MTAVLPRTTGRHRAPETAAEPGRPPADELLWADAAAFRAAWTRGRHAAPEPSGRHAAAEDGDVFDWLGFAPATD